MSEEIFMNRKVINVELTALDEKTDLLQFKFDDNVLAVNLNSPLCQNDLKAVFVRLLQMLIENDVSLEFYHADDYSRKMYIEVCKEYINDLNRELTVVKDRILKEI